MENKLCYIIPLLLTVCSCVSNVDDRVVLRVSAVSVTEYEWSKNFDLFKTAFLRANGHAPGENDIRKWKQGFIDRAYFLADAYQKGYDTLAYVSGKVWGMEQMVISEQIGRKVKDGAGMNIDRETLDGFNAKLLEQGGLHEFDKRMFSDLLPRTIMTYRINGQTVRVSVGQFIDFYNDLPLRREIDSGGQVVSYLEDLVHEDYAYKKAQESGMTKDRKFLLDKENFRRNVIYSLYETQELKSGTDVTPREIKDYYDTTKNAFTRPIDVVVSAFFFKNKNDAVFGMMHLKRSMGDAAFLRGAGRISPHWKLNYTSTELSDSIKSVIFGMRTNEVSRPMPLDGQFIVVVKESESGNRVAGLDEVHDIIAKEIKDQKIEKKKQAYLVRLKSMYKRF